MWFKKFKPLNVNERNNQRLRSNQKRIKDFTALYYSKTLCFFGHTIVMAFLILKYFFSSILKPKNWPLFFLILTGAPLSKSLKTKQKIVKL